MNCNDSSFTFLIKSQVFRFLLKPNWIVYIHLTKHLYPPKSSFILAGRPFPLPMHPPGLFVSHTEFGGFRDSPLNAILMMVGMRMQIRALTRIRLVRCVVSSLSFPLSIVLSLFHSLSPSLFLSFSLSRSTRTHIFTCEHANAQSFLLYAHSVGAELYVK